ncbi:MAG: NUDIX domain-containing protein [Deltaproteobacteria bacterium]|nr:NUDIX domain-containing protein [Deltaproteobacteria bacterium]
MPMSNSARFPVSFNGPHLVCCKEKGRGYPSRFHVPDDKVQFSVAFPSYAPKQHTADIVLSQFTQHGATGWADPPEPLRENLTSGRELKSQNLDDDGLPKYPEGRTGLLGRGLLGRWGANIAADVVLTKGRGDDVKVLCILRRDKAEWALPGGMVDEGETNSQAAERELREECGVQIDFSKTVLIYAGYVDDPRNTDQSWMETFAFHFHFDDDDVANALSPVAGDDAAEVQWRSAAFENLGALYASHARLVIAAVERVPA